LANEEGRPIAVTKFLNEAATWFQCAVHVCPSPVVFFKQYRIAGGPMVPKAMSTGLRLLVLAILEITDPNSTVLIPRSSQKQKPS
jgi:hypothetical protein